MPLDRVLVRKNEDGKIRVFVPSRPAPHGYVKEYTPEGYRDIALWAYKKTRDADPLETKRAFQHFLTKTDRPARLAQRLPRDYQKFPEEGSYVLVNRSGLFCIEDSQGVLMYAVADAEKAKTALRRLEGRE